MYSSVLITAPDPATARKIAIEMVGAKLAACANLIAANSIYRWKGDIESQDETLVILKARTSDFEAIQEAVLREHPYELPCIVRHEIDGYPPYLEWIRESTERHPED